MIHHRLFRIPALVATGALQTLAFAPFHLWPAALVSLVLILVLCSGRDARALFRDGWFLGVGLFGSGASWVYVSINEYGMTAAPLAAVMTLLFAMGLALFPAIAFWCWGRLAGHHTGRSLWLFPAVWVLTDWVRGWLLTGFPWLYAGTAQVDGPLAGWAPVLGVHGVTFIMAATAALLVAAWRHYRAKPYWVPTAFAAAALVPWLLAPLVSLVEWTQPQGDPLSVAAVQGNISQHDKWDPDKLREQIRIYRELTEPLWGRDLILWPETALPATQGQASQVLDALESRAFDADTTLVTGLPWYGDSPHYAEPVFHNSLMTVGPGQGTYHKQRLVPFGEYVPLESLLRGTIEFLSLPMSVFRPGPDNQSPLQVADARTHPAICYEIAYADFVAQHAVDTGFLMTVSNDAWFGRSHGPFQHHQIARMRALETSRELLRGTNNGITSIVDREGRIRETARHYERDVLKGQIQPVTGRTPFMATGSWPVVTLAAIMIVFGRQRRGSA
ncbi:MAG: apolipoprotein N-acyltransferase [Pseudomonadota bacterium]